MADGPQPDTLSLEQERQIDAVCRRFEAVWQSGQRPVIEEHLGGIPPECRAGLLGELVKLDLCYRRQLGERPTPDEYLARFSDDRPVIHAAFAEPATGTDCAARGGESEAGATVAGRYKLRQLFGEGGMGAVWVADQLEPVRRRVALKVIKAGLNSAQVLARFEQERQALALMDHPNIAKVFDAGVSPPVSVGGLGTPYIVMELIKGVPITQYCDDARLTPRQRLELFVPVCQAVQHAHQKGIIHRDLKPGNVLIALYDGKPIPKVIDFGVAKATGPRLTEQTVYTDVGAIVGTLEYMAPEQAELNNLDIDTRADIYALGVILYELLTGSVPLSRKQLQSAGLAEMVRVIKEVEPSKPSTKITGSDALPAIAAARQTEPRKLALLVRGELDWITMKALEKERSRRYETANGLASDILRYLNDEPVAAGPPSAGYRLRKFVRKHKGQVIAAGLLMATLVTGLVASLTLLTWAKTAEAKLQVSNDALGKESAERQRAADSATTEAANARMAKEHAEFEAYVANLIAADASLIADEPMRVRARLDACPERLRNWEWRYLDARSDQSLFVLPGHFAALSPAGDCVVTATDDGIARVWDAETGKGLTELRGQGRPVTSVAFSPAGDRVVTASNDGTARVWDVGTGKQIAQLDGDGGRVFSAAISPAGVRVVTASNDGTARVWDVGTGKPIAELRGHVGVRSAAFNLAGNRVVTVSFDARVWDVGTGKQLFAPSGSLNSAGGPVISAAFSPAGDRVVTAVSDGTARVWDAETGKQLFPLRGHGGLVTSASFSPAGNRIVTASNDGTARVWDAGTGKEVVTLSRHAVPVRSAAFNWAGDRVVTASSDGTARVWDVGTGKPITILGGHRGPVTTAAFNRAGDRVVTASSDGTARVWEAATDRGIVALRGHGGLVTSAAFSAAGDRIVAASTDGTARVWDAGTGKPIAELRGHGGPVRSAGFNRAGDRVVTASDDRTVRVWDAVTGRGVVTLGGHVRFVTSAAFSPAGNRVVAASSDGIARVWDVGTGKPIAELREHLARSAWISPAGDRVATMSFNGTARVWDVGTGKPIAHLGGDGDRVSSAAFSLAGDRVVTMSLDGTARVWDLGTGVPIAELRGQGDRVTARAFSPAGDRVITVSKDGSVRVWDVGTGVPIAELRGHGDPFRFAAFSAGGDRIVTASSDWTLRVWDADTGKELGALRGHGGRVTSAAFSPVGDRVVSVSEDGTARIWDSVPYRERYPAIAAARATEKVMRDRLAARLRAGEDLDQIAQSLVDDRSLDEVHRRVGLALVCEERERRLAEAQKLQLDARPVVTKPDSQTDAVAAALDQARHASTLTPDDAIITNTLGMALYRAGKYEEAIATLTKAEEQYAKSGGPRPADWAFLAMAQFKLGKADEAKKSLARLRELMKDTRHAGNAENQAFLREAEALIEPK